jgi:hypothetical protein
MLICNFVNEYQNESDEISRLLISRRTVPEILRGLTRNFNVAAQSSFYSQMTKDPFYFFPEDASLGGGAIPWERSYRQELF